MIYEMEVTVFRFDAKSDYLPYFKRHLVSVDSEEKLEDLLKKIKDEDISFDYPEDQNAAVKVEGKNLFIKTSIKDLVNEFGTEFGIYPLSEKRAIKDLIIDKRDFYEKFDLIDPFVDSIDKKRFEEMIIYHYASDVIRYCDEYLGDALILFAYEMVEKYPAQTENILKILARKDNGIFLHTPICNKIFPKAYHIERKINRLKNKILSINPPINGFIANLKKESL